MNFMQKLIRDAIAEEVKKMVSEEMEGADNEGQDNAGKNETQSEQTVQEPITPAPSNESADTGASVDAEQAAKTISEAIDKAVKDKLYYTEAKPQKTLEQSYMEVLTSAAY